MKKLSLSLRLVIVIIFAAAAAAAAIGANAAGYRPLDPVREFLGIAPPAPIAAPAKAEAAATPRFFAPSSTLLVEDFDYTSGDAITSHGWSSFLSLSPVISVSSPGLSYAGFLSSGIGNSASLSATGENDSKAFTSQTSGSVYSAAMVNVAAAGTSGEFFLSIGPTAIDTSSLFGRVWVKRDASNNLAFGVSKKNGTVTYTPFSYSLSTTYLVVTKYTFVSGSSNDTVSLYLNPTISSTEPSATILAADINFSDPANIGCVVLRQGNTANAPTVKVDGIRVATTWNDLFPPPPPTVNLSVSTNSASEASPAAVIVNATASSAVVGNQTVSLGVSGTGITAGDYTLSNATITIPSGQTTGSVTFTVVDDDVYEVPEIATLTISNPSAGITLGSTVSQNITIADNDNAPNVHFTAERFAGSEGGVQISIDRSGAPGNDFFVDLNSGAGGGESCSTGTDYIKPNSPLHFIAGETNKTFTVQFCADLIYEGNESFDIYLANPTGGAFVGAQNVAFMDAADNDTKPTFDISTAATSVDEGVGTVTITVNRSGAPGNDVSVDLSVGGGTATIDASCTAGVDYVGGGQHLLFPPGTTSVPYNITICNDAVTEPAETFTATLSNPQYPAQLGTTISETVTINASDATATTVYVDSSWNCTTPGTDPDGAGPATSCGTDAFTTIADGIAGVADGGSVIINPGTYMGDMKIGHPSLIKGKFAISGELEAQVPGVVVSPGQSPGIITSGSLVLTSGSELDIELNGTNPGTGHDQMKVTTGPVDLGGATLVLSALGGYRPTAGDQFTIINNQGGGAVIGTFDGLPEATTVSDGTSSYTISYVGGDGNDVVLTATTGGCGNVVSIPAVTSPTGVTATVRVNTTDLTGLGVIAADFVVTYDPAVLNPATINVTAGTAASPGATVTFNASVPGTIVISVFNGTVGGSFTGPGPLVNIAADVIGPLGTTALTVTGGGFNGGLVCSSSANGSIQVVQAATTTTVASNVNPSTYGDTVTFTATVASTPAVGNNGTVDFVIDSTTVCAAVAVNAGQATCQTAALTVPGSPHVVNANYLGATNFAPGSGTLSGGQTVDPAAPVITVTGSNTFTYNGSPLGPDTATTGGSTSVPTFSYSGTSNGSVAYGPSSTKPTLAGSYTVTASVVADANYTAASSAPFAFTIGRATPVVTVTGATFTFNGSPQGPSSASTGGSTGTLSFSYSGSPNGGGTYGPSATPPTAAGSYTVTASVAQDDNYNAASSSATPFTIDRASTTTTLAFEAGPYVYRGTAFTATAEASGTGNIGFTASVTPTYSGDCVHVTVTDGCTATATYAGDNNHTGSSDIKSITITKAAATITVAGFSGTYDGLAHGVVSSTASGVLSESLTGLTIDPTTYRNVPGGSVNWSFTNQNYTDQSGSATVTITKRGLTITAVTDSKTYNGTTASSATPSISGLQTGDTITSLTQVFQSKNVLGTDLSTLEIASFTVNDSNSGNNYNVTSSGTAVGTIAKAPLTISARADSKTYDGTTDSSLTPTHDALFSGDTFGTLSQAFQSKDVLGTNGSTLQAAYSINDTNGGNNYNVTANTALGTITKKTLVITPDPQVVLYGTADPAFTFGYSGFVLLEGPGNLTTLPVCSVPGTSPHAPGAYTISCVAGTAVNYDFNVTPTANFLVNSGSVAGSVTYLINPGPTPKPVPNVHFDAPGSTNINGSSAGNGSYSLTGFGAGAYTVTPSRTAESCGGNNGVQVNDATLIARYVVGLDSLSNEQKLAAKVSGSVTTTISSFDAALVAQRVVCITNGLSLAGQWRFAPANRAYSTGVTSIFTSQDFSAYLMGDVDGNWNPAGTNLSGLLSQPNKDSINVSVPAMMASQGSVVTVPFRVENLGGRAVGAYQFDIGYDPAVVSPAEIAADVAGTLGSNLSVVFNAPEPGRLKVAVYGAFPATGDGVYVNLRFNVLGGAGSATPLNISNVVINDGSQPVFAASGSLSVTASANNGTIRGRLLSATGQPVGNARVTVTSTTGSLSTAVTNPFGLFELGNLSVGETYTVTVESKRYTFTPRTVSMTDGIVDLDMIADQ